MVVGEIGMARHEFLYDVQFWEIRRIIRGYRNRYRDMWSASRWQAFNIMASMTDLKKAGIHAPTDLIKFPWEKENRNSEIPTDDEIKEMQEYMQKINERG